MLIEKVQNYPGIEYITKLNDGRHLLNAKLDVLTEREPFTKKRAKDPKDVNHLVASIERTGGPLHHPLAHVTAEHGEFEVVIADGRQLLRAARQNGQTSIRVMWVEWENDAAALRDAMEADYARFAMEDADIIAVMDVERFTDKEIASITGRSESTISRINAVRSNPKVKRLVVEGAMTYTQGYALVNACDNNHDKVQILNRTLGLMEVEAMRKAEKVKAEIAKQPHRRWGKRRDLQNHFKILKGEKWSIVASAIKEGTTTESGSGDPVVDITEAARQTMPIEIGSSSEWDEKLAVNNFFGRKIDDVEISDIQEMLDFIPDLEKYLTAILNRKARMQALTEKPIPDDRSIQELQSPIKPDGQNVDGIQIGDD